MKIVYYIFLLLSVFIIISCNDKNSFILHGNIEGLQNSELYIVSGENLLVDTIRAKSGKFTYRGVSQTVEPLLIYVQNKNTGITIWVKNGEKYSLTGDVNHCEAIIVKGGSINTILTEFKTEHLLLIKEKCELREKLSTYTEQHTEPNTNNNYSELVSQLKNVNQALKTHAQDFIETHSSSIAALVLIQNYILDIENASNIQHFLDIVSDEVKTNPLYEQLQLFCMKDLQTKAGQPALNFMVKDTKNDSIGLVTFKDKYLILAFASSFCELCESEYNELLAIQNNFPEKELAILTISIDENKEDWNKLAREKGINWIQVIDSTGWASEMVSLYNVMTIPCNFLIDKNGMIIGSKLRSDSIQAILKEKLRTKN